VLKLRDLAVRTDFRIGTLFVSPSRRIVEGLGGTSHLEPLIMQVFLRLLEGDGRVVTRDELLSECWGGATTVQHPPIIRCRS
jgi:DNA-binding winged helix-turn-helix (wHTH) protein